MIRLLKHVITAGIIATAMLFPASAQAAPPAGVSPAVVISAAARQLTRMDAELVPVHLAVKDWWSAVRSSLSLVDTLSYRLSTEVLLGKGEEALMALIAATDALTESIDALDAAARAGIDVLDAFPPAPCFADYWAVERVAFRLIGDSVESLRIGDMASANAQIGHGLYLFQVQAELERSIAVC